MIPYILIVLSKNNTDQRSSSKYRGDLIVVLGNFGQTYSIVVPHERQQLNGRDCLHVCMCVLSAYMYARTCVCAYKILLRLLSLARSLSLSLFRARALSFSLYVCIYLCMYVCMYIRVYVCLYVYTYLCMYAYVYIYITVQEHFVAPRGSFS
jgi:hypothetical protein